MTPNALAELTALTSAPLDLIDVDPDSSPFSLWASASRIPIPQPQSSSQAQSSSAVPISPAPSITAPYSRVCEKSPTKAHHWLIAPPDGVPSEGICKHCRTTRLFRNSMEFVWKTVPGATVPAGMSGRI